MSDLENISTDKNKVKLNAKADSDTSTTLNKKVVKRQVLTPSSKNTTNVTTLGDSKKVLLGGTTKTEIKRTILQKSETTSKAKKLLKPTTTIKNDSQVTKLLKKSSILPLSNGKKKVLLKANSDTSGTSATNVTKSTKKLLKRANTSATNHTVLLKNTSNITIGNSFFDTINRKVDPKSDVKRIMLVDDELSILKVLSHILTKQGFSPYVCNSGESALSAIPTVTPSLIISDLKLGATMDGLQFLKEVKLSYPDIPVVIVTGYASIKVVIQALKDGAFDLLTKPFKMDQLADVIENALDHQNGYNINTIAKQDMKLHFGSIIGENEAMQKVYTLIKRISKTDATILINGEKGCQKNELAEIVHFCSRRAGNPFVKVDAKLLAQEHVHASIIGNMALKANEGTLYIKDLEFLPMDAQELLLEIITNKEFNGNKLDLRIMASTATPLKDLIVKQEFSKGLYYRLCAFTLDIPPLRKRVEDIPLLVNYFCFNFAEETERELEFSDQSMNVLLNHTWDTANVDELNDLLREVAMSTEENLITLEMIPEEIVRSANSSSSSVKKESVGKIAREFLKKQVSAKTNNNHGSLKIKTNN